MLCSYNIVLKFSCYRETSTTRTLWRWCWPSEPCSWWWWPPWQTPIKTPARSGKIRSELPTDEFFFGLNNFHIYLLCLGLCYFILYYYIYIYLLTTLSDRLLYHYAMYCFCNKNTGCTVFKWAMHWVWQDYCFLTLTRLTFQNP